MDVTELFRVVAVRKGKMPPAEFRLREDEKGLSLFAHEDRLGPEQVIEAVRGVGKKGELKAAVIRMEEIDGLGLTIVQTAGGTASEEVNAIHYEARFRWWRGLLLRIQGVQIADYFNEHVAPKLWAAAHLLD